MRGFQSVALAVAAGPAQLGSAIGVGYNSECQMDSECRAKTNLLDSCCAQLIYESNGVEVKKRECVAKSAMDDAGGNYQFEGVTTTEAYCDKASTLGVFAATLVTSAALLALI